VQKDVDGKVYAAAKKIDNLSKYLKASWGLSRGQYPHALAF
jgi:large subunit ribosomal protein L6e